MSDFTAVAVTPAFVLDIQGDIQHHQNGSAWVRLLVHEETAKALYLSLQEHFG